MTRHYHDIHPDRSDKMSPSFERFLAATTYTVLVAIILGIGSCVRYERERERSCMQAGGSITSVNTAEGRKMCAKVTVEPIQTKAK